MTIPTITLLRLSLRHQALRPVSGEPAKTRQIRRNNDPTKMDNDPPQIQQCLTTSPNIHVRVKKGAKLILRYANTNTVEVTARFLWQV